jgi:hypothetical protein
MTDDIRSTEFFRQVVRDVVGPRHGGAIFIIDAEKARKGVGKTGCAIALARLFAAEFGYELVEDDLVLGGEAYLRRLQEHPGTDQPSCVVWDEAVGAGSGDARRSMAEQNRVLGQAWQTMRTKRVLQFVTLPTWNELDVRLRRLADYRVWCQAEPIGYFKPYSIGVPFEGDGLRTEGIGPDSTARRIAFPNLDAADDPLYGYLSERKGQLLDADSFDADDVLDAVAATDGGEKEEEIDVDDIRDEEQIKTAVRAVVPWDDDRGMSRRKAARLVDYSYGWVRDRVEEWERGQHRDLVDPEHKPAQ